MIVCGGDQVCVIENFFDLLTYYNDDEIDKMLGVVFLRKLLFISYESMRC